MQAFIEIKRLFNYFNIHNCLVVVLFLIAPSLWASDTTSYRYHAYDLKSGAFLYTEKYSEHWKNDKHISSRISYWKGKKLIAVKKVRYTRSKTAPDYGFKDYRLDYIRGAKFRSGAYHLYSTSHTDRDLKKKTLNVPGLVVVDGGFDYYIRKNFNSLKKGKAHVVNVITPGFMSSISFKLLKLRRSTYKGRKTIVLKIVPNNLILRMLADKIETEYDLETKRMLVYRGISNIKNPQGKYYRARIVFDYKRYQTHK